MIWLRFRQLISTDWYRKLLNIDIVLVKEALLYLHKDLEEQLVLVTAVYV